MQGTKNKQKGSPCISHVFLETVRLFCGADSFKGSEISIYHFPHLSSQSYDKVVQMYNNGSTLRHCCRYLRSIFIFDPAFVSGIDNGEFDKNESTMGLIANTIGWIGSEEFCTPDFFDLLLTSLLKFSNSQIMYFCVKSVIETYDNTNQSVLSMKLVQNISKFCTKTTDILTNFSILTSLLRIAIRSSENEEVSDGIITIYTSLMSTSPNSFGNIDFSNILALCSTKLNKFNLHALSLLSIIADVNPNDTINVIFINLAKSIFYLLAAQTDQQVLHDFGKNTDFDSPFDFYINFETFQKIGKQIEPLPPDAYYSGIKILSQLSEKGNAIYSSMKTVLLNKQPKVVIAFIKSLTETLSKQFIVDIFIFIMEFINEHDLNEIPEEIFETVFNCPVFSPTSVIFFDKENFTQMNAFRNYALGIIMNKWPKKIDTIIRNADTNPYLFAEHIGRIQTVIQYPAYQEFIQSSTISSLAHVLESFLYHLTTDCNDFDEAFSAWSTIFGFVLLLIEDLNGAELCFESIEFSNIVLNHIFHNSLRQLILDDLKKYMTLSNGSLNTIAQFSLKVFRYALFGDSNYQTLATDFLACLEDTMSHRQDIVVSLSGITSDILTFFLHHPTNELLKYTLNFLLLVSFSVDEFSFSQEDTIKLGNVIKEMEPEGLSETNISILISLLSGKKSVSLSTLFLIRNPSFILLLFNSSADDIAPIIKVFANLCKFSIYNCAQCHKGELDLLLIEMVKSYPEPFYFYNIKFSSTMTEDEVKTIVFPLLNLIYSYRCSPQSAERFISLAVPKSIDEFPQNSDFVFDQIFKFLIEGRKTKYVYSPKAKPSLFVALPYEQIQNGFTFSCFVKVDHAMTSFEKSKPVFFKLIDSVKTTFTLFLNGTSLLCEISSEWGVSSASLTNNIPPCEWTMITICVRRKEELGQLHLNFSLNKDSPLLFVVRDPTFQGPTFNVEIGGYIDEPSHFSYCFLGGYYLINEYFSSSSVAQLYSNGLKTLIQYKNMLKKKKSKKSLPYLQTFSQVFKKYDLIESFLPFFEFINVSPTFFIERVIDLFKYVDKGQCEDYYLLISHSLMKCDPTYSIYLRFYNLFTETNSKSLFQNILFNFNLWTQSTDASHLKRILLHWANVLFPDSSQYFIEYTTFAEILSQVRVYFWYSPEEIDIIKRKRPQNLDTAACRNNLNKLLSKFAAVSFTDDDCCTLISHILTVHDDLQKISLLILLQEVKEQILNRDKVIDQIQAIFTTAKEDILSAALETIYVLSPAKFHNNIEIVLSNLNIHQFTEPIFNTLKELVKPIPEFTVFCCMLAANLSDEIKIQMIDIMEEVAKSPESCLQINMIKTWFFWPVVLMLKVEKATQNKAAKVLCSIMYTKPSTIDKILGFLDLIQLYFKMPVLSIQLRILSYICEMILSDAQMSNEAATRMIFRCIRYMFFRISPHNISPNLIRVFNESPFAIDSAIKIRIPEQIELNLMTHIKKLFKQNISDLELRFGIDYDSKRQELFDTLIGQIQMLKAYAKNDQTIAHFFNLFDYMSQRNMIEPIKRAEYINKIASEARPNFRIMGISFSHFLDSFEKEFHAYLSQVFHKAHDLLSAIDAKTIQYSIQELADTKQKQQLFESKAEYKVQVMYHQTMNPFSIWKLFHQVKSITVKDFTLSDNLEAPFYRQKYNIQHVEIPQIVVRALPIARTSARLIRFSGPVPCLFVLLQQQILIITKTKAIYIDNSSMKYILYRSKSSYEFILKGGKSYLVEFSNYPINNLIYYLRFIQFPSETLIQTNPFISFINKIDVTNMWLSGALNNYQYIMRLNLFGGRSFHNVHLYPIFPFISLTMGDLNCVRKFTCDVGYVVKPEVWLRMFDNFTPILRSNRRAVVHDEQISFDLVITELPKSDVETAASLDSEIINESTDLSVDDDDTSDLSSSISFSQTFEIHEYELTPEFYTNPECFNNLALPMNTTLFVYKMRKALESEEITKTLNIWIDRIFGYEKRSRNVVQLFKNPHPSKVMKYSPLLKKECTFTLWHTGTLAFASLYFKGDTKLLIYSINNIGHIQATLIDLANNGNNSRPFTAQLDIEKKHILSYVDTLVFLDCEEGVVTRISSNGINFTKQDIPPTDYCDSNSKACCGFGGNAFITDLNSNEVVFNGFCHVSPENPVCVASSAMFNITVVGVRSGKLIIFYRDTGKYKSLVSLNGRVPKRITITKEWGFIIVQFNDALTCFSREGDKITEVEIKYDIDCWENWTSPSGFDYLAIADTMGHIFLLEAISLEKGEELIKCGSKVLAMKCSNKLPGIVVFTQEAKGIFIPYYIK